MLVDSHCHLDRLDAVRSPDGLAGVLELAVAHGVQHLLSVATDLDPCHRGLCELRAYPQVALSVGVHPSEQEGRAPTVAELVALAQEPRVVAIGETGLDYYYGRESGGNLMYTASIEQYGPATPWGPTPAPTHT